MGWLTLCSPDEVASGVCSERHLQELHHTIQKSMNNLMQDKVQGTRLVMSHLQRSGSRPPWELRLPLKIVNIPSFVPQGTPPTYTQSM